MATPDRCCRGAVPRAFASTSADLEAQSQIRILVPKTLGQMAEYGATKNAIVNLENDYLHNEDLFFISRGRREGRRSYLRVLRDFGNTLLGGDPAYDERGVAAMPKHAYGVPRQRCRGDRQRQDLQC